jgi:hypothetical protein
MLIALVIILLLIWAAVVWSIYSNFMVFYSNFAESENYHRAYYNSIAALERAELVIKQREPWYIWYWGWKLGGVNKWSYDELWPKEWGSDRIIDKNFSYVSDEHSQNISSIYWYINSRTTKIPMEWNWDIDTMLSDTDSEDYNMMDYKDSQVFLLYYDNWKSNGKNDNPYNKISCKDWSPSCTQSYPSSIEWTIRLPWKLKTSFGLLDDEKTLVVGWPKDDAIVDWQIRWRYYDNDNNSYPFNVYWTQRSYGEEIDYVNDSAIRESDINGNFWFALDIWPGKKSPITIPNAKNHSRSITSSEDLTIISPKEAEIKGKISDLKDIINENNYMEKQFRLSLLNLLKSINMVYPFLEYNIDFWVPISDKYFTINAEWNYNDYQINKIIRKPTNKESVLWSFTTIF